MDDDDAGTVVIDDHSADVVIAEVEYLLDVAARDLRILLAQLDQSAVGVEQAVLVLELLLHAAELVFHDPRHTGHLDVGQLLIVPDHRRAIGRVVAGVGRFDPDLLAVVGEGVAGREHIQRRRHLIIILVEHIIRAYHIMVREEVGVDRVLIALFDIVIILFEFAQRVGGHAVACDHPFAAGVRKLEVEQAVDPALIHVIDIARVIPVLTDHIHVGIVLLRHGVKPFEEFYRVGVLIFKIFDSVKTESVYALFKPKLRDLFKVLARTLVAQIPVGHIGREGTLIIIVRAGDRTVVGLVRFFGYIIVAGIAVLFALSELVACLEEELVIVAAVVEHQVDDHADTAVVRLFDQGVKVSERTEVGVDLKVVADVVFMIRLRGHHRRQPDAVRTEVVAAVRVAVVDVVKLGDQSGQIADPVAV